MKTLLKFVCVIAVLSVAVAETNYCQLSCPDYSTTPPVIIQNIGCGHDKSFSATCPPNAEVVPLTERMKQMIVDRHNEKRNFIAGGGDANHDPACHMSALQWDADLAELAELNLKQCNMEHDFCHRTNRFEMTGQSKTEFWDQNFTRFDVDQYPLQAVEGWYSEVQYSNKQIIKSFPAHKPPPLRDFAHFTVMMADRVTHVGCAGVQLMKNSTKYYLFTCNYSFTNLIGSPIYEDCLSPGQSCPNGKHSSFENLCA